LFEAVARGPGACETSRIEQPIFPLPATAPLTVKLLNGDASVCWGASYTTEQLLRNEAAQLKAKAP